MDQTRIRIGIAKYKPMPTADQREVVIPLHENDHGFTHAVLDYAARHWPGCSVMGWVYVDKEREEMMNEIVRHIEAARKESDGIFVGDPRTESIQMALTHLVDAASLLADKVRKLELKTYKPTL